jgi:large subunit ribosomal protein L1
MAAPRTLLAPMSRLATCSLAAARPEALRFATLPYQTVRSATTKAQPKKKKKARNTFIQYDLRKAEQFSLIDAMQCVWTRLGGERRLRQLDWD